MPSFKCTLLEVLFPKVRARLLQLLFTEPGNQQYVRQLAGSSGLALHTVQDELRRLSAVGLLTNWSNGYHRFYQANRDHPLCSHLFHIVHLSENLPRAAHSALRQTRGRIAKRRRVRKPRPLPKDYPIKWHLFSKSGSHRPS